MSVKLLVPDGIFEGYYRKYRWGALGIFAHTLQCGQRWIFLIRIGRRRFGYRTRGDAKKNMLTYQDGGWHFPWQKGFEDIPFRTVSGRG